MERNGLDTAAMIAMRRNIHKHAEGGFQEHQTQATLKEMLLKIGVDKHEIKSCAGTGLVVDLQGKAKPSKAAKLNCIALRADMDALPMPENNPDLEYKS